MSPRSLLVLTVLVLVLSGCSAGSSDVQPTPDPFTPQPTTAPTSQTPSPSPTTSSQPTDNGTLDVHFINVGQSTSILIVGPTGETMLIDTAHWQDDGSTVLSYLDRQGIDRIDYLITSHADADHIGGHAEVIEQFETEEDGIGAVYDPGIAATSQTYERYLDAIEAHNVTLYRTREGDTIPFEGVRVQVLAPPEPALDDGTRNENSIVLRLGFGETRFLFTGDGESVEETYLVENHRESLNATILKAGHHGSRSSSSPELLDASDPRVVVISSAYDSQYGHPHQEVLERLASRNVPTYWTAVHGTVLIESNGTALGVYTQARATTDPLSLRSHGSIQPGDTSPLKRVQVIPIGSPRQSVPGPTIADGGTQTAGSSESLVVTAIHADAEGNDRDNLNDEYIVLENRGGSGIDLSGWSVSDAAGHEYVFPKGFTLDADSRVTIHTGSGTDTATDLYWGSSQPIWNNSGDTITVRDSEGRVVEEEQY